MADKRRIVIVGSTGSIGQSTLRVVERYPERLEVVGLAAGTNASLLAEQAQRWRPEVVALADAAGLERLRQGLSGTSCEVLAGPEGLAELAGWPSADTAVIATVGFSGVRPTLAAIEARKRVALANKETLVTAGSIVMPLAEARGVDLVPIDSEHSAIAQCLRAGGDHEVERLILTASGGPFRTRSPETFGDITPEEALAHPTWRMGPRITIDSATMMNKGFEVIEAAWLFGMTPDRVDVVIHPESIIHSMVEFRDGSVIAQMGEPDMTLPITYALFAPERLSAVAETPRYDPRTSGSLHFEDPDPTRFPALALARQAWAAGPTGGAVLNAADEVAVEAFLAGKLSFPGIIELVRAVLDDHEVVRDADIDDIEAADRWARMQARRRIETVGRHEPPAGYARTAERLT
ncbi:MAG TPA: 1-deoxy-D-xylulose-5-phosphate reductoisomerase [Acidobacteriota bacterium]|nr:1-deoxy-D-xylulose-5-phosphate reductoisomerase [Acidobacteriota bacterium]